MYYIIDHEKTADLHTKYLNSYSCVGEFGMVYRGLLVNWNNISVQGVAVKTLKGNQGACCVQ